MLEEPMEMLEEGGYGGDVGGDAGGRDGRGGGRDYLTNFFVFLFPGAGSGMLKGGFWFLFFTAMRLSNVSFHCRVS